MPDNVQTSQEWKKVSDEQFAKAAEIAAQRTLAQQQLDSIPATLGQISRAASVANAEGDNAKADALIAQSMALREERKQLMVKVNELDNQYSETNAAGHSALRQSQQASDGPSNASSTPAPASDKPGDNTAVAPPATTPQAAVSSNVDNGSDPYVSNGQTTIPRADTGGATVDDGSDPYVSNGKSTIPPPSDGNTTVPNTSGLNGQVPGLQVFDDGSSIQTFDDGSTLVTDTDGKVTSTPAIDAVPATRSQSQAVGGAGANEMTITASRLSSSTQEFPKPTDWRFRVSLAPGAKYFYNDSNPGILLPLKATKGVVFPYTPSIQIAYNANYEASDLTHSNYKIYNYKNSSVDSITISGDFTAQDTTEANYMLAVIHFFRTMTKMFYGQDNNPSRGTPPPLCYLSGFGEYQFDNHPVAITNFTYNMPTDVDYINATTKPGNISLEPYKKASNTYQTPLQRLFGSGLRPGGAGSKPVFTVSDPTKVTRVPTKITLSITCIPIVTRNAISNEFSLQEYSTGSLLRGSKNPGTGGGIW